MVHFTFILSALAMLAAVPSALAAADMGTINLSRDYAIQFHGYATTPEFCHAFRAGCVAYAGARNNHHQIDCYPAQNGPVIRAFCGGIQKTAQGTWTAGETVTPFTTDMIGLVPRAQIVGPPVDRSIIHHHAKLVKAIKHLNKGHNH